MTKEKKRTGRMAFTWDTDVEIKKGRCSFLALISKLNGALSLRGFGKVRV